MRSNRILYAPRSFGKTRCASVYDRLWHRVHKLLTAEVLLALGK